MLAAAGWPISELVPHGSDSILQTTVSRARQTHRPLAVPSPPLPRRCPAATPPPPRRHPTLGRLASALAALA